MRFDGAKVEWSSEGFPYVDAQGNYARTKYPQRASAGDVFFAVQTFDGKSIAVFDLELSTERRKQIEGARPDWLHAILYADPAKVQLPPVGKVLAEIGYGGDLAPELCAFIASTVFEGSLEYVPVVFFVYLRDHGIYEVTLTFDWEAESWSGDVIVQSLVDDD